MMSIRSKISLSLVGIMAFSYLMAGIYIGYQEQRISEYRYLLSLSINELLQVKVRKG